MDFERIKRAITRVDARDDGARKTGTAFYIGGKYVMTALHVVANTQVRPPAFLRSIKLQFPDVAELITATVVDGLWSADGDWTVLECETLPDAVAIEIGAEPALGTEWITYGFPEIKPTGMTIAGKVRDARHRPLPGFAELPLHPVLQLFSEEAGAGMGARMHGFSGAPCLVDGKAVGVLRSTLIEEIVDGQSQRLLFTQAGTLYATPARSVVEWQADRHKAILPGSWAPPGIVTRDFIVLLSQQEPGPAQQARKPKKVALRDVAQVAYRNTKDSGLGLSQPYFLDAAEAVASEERLRDCVRALCNAKVVVFDATDFEPAIMFLAGIRAVVRRGLTLLSVGGEYALGKNLLMPFNVIDANIVAHSHEQNRSAIANSVTLLTQRIQRGLDAMRSPQYLDLPVYDAIRRLPVERRGIIPKKEGVLVLCPFEEGYTSFWDENLKQALTNELNNLRKEDKSVASFGVSRSFELNSPRLVTHAVYEAIRRFQSCVIDLSYWSANVLFELGVRLAASGERTACIIEKDWEGKVREEWLPQCQSIESLFVADPLKYDPEQSWVAEPAFCKAYGPDEMPLDKPLLLDGALHALVERALDVDLEPASRPVVLDLRDQAATFMRDPKGGRTKPGGLFVGNPALVEREDIADFERLLAAWLYASNRYTPDEIMDDAAIRDAVYDVVEALFERHSERLAAESESAAAEMMDKIEEWRKQHG